MSIVNGNYAVTADGKRIVAGCYISDYERFMHMQGYSAVPKDDVDSVTKQDLIDHPEKFRPYTHAKCSNFCISYEKFANGDLKYENGKWDRGDHVHLRLKEDLIGWDLMYMKEHHPKLYKKLLLNNDLPVQDDVEVDTDNTSQQQASRGKPHHTTIPIITTDQVNADKIPERITYVRKKVGDGFMFVVEDEQDSKVTPGNNGKSVDAAEINYTYIPEPSDLKL